MNTLYYPKCSVIKLASHYLSACEDFITPADCHKFTALIDREYKKAKQHLKEERVTGQPYQNAEELFADIEQNNRIQVSLDFNDPAIVDPETNLKYRFTHDYHHFLLRCGFDWLGEIVACSYFCSLTNDDTVQRILRSELIYQAAAYFYLGNRFPETQKIVLSDPN